MYRSKRLFDYVFAFIGLALLVPVFVALSVALLITSGFPVMYVQERVGRNWKMFKLYKFRTMVSNAAHEGLVCFKNDYRITPLGRFLRTYKLDELPQLYNVLKGDMSFVGPRPEVLEFANFHRDLIDKHIS
ncbi:MAG: sugar transferase, partial [Elusimicrobia bacterium]|nr:sugar transferase [Elusimicrobiota bacterium]